EGAGGDRGGDGAAGDQPARRRRGRGRGAGRHQRGAVGRRGGAMSEATSSAPAVELRELRKSFGKTEIIRGAELAVAAGGRVEIIGPNGAGKSTLFNLISGRFAPT